MVNSPILPTYLDGLSGPDVAAVPASTALDAAVIAAAPELVAAIKYQILLYSYPGDTRHWVCAVNAKRDGSCLRFLYGVLLDDPLKVLRPGSATLMTWDFAAADPIDPGAVGDYVRAALGQYEYFKANSAEVSRQAKAEAGRRPITP
jgi:hypothetical protein